MLSCILALPRKWAPIREARTNVLSNGSHKSNCIKSTLRYVSILFHPFALFLLLRDTLLHHCSGFPCCGLKLPCLGHGQSESVNESQVVVSSQTALQLQENRLLVPSNRLKFRLLTAHLARLSFSSVIRTRS